MTTWCHGAPGVGLDRLAGIPLAELASIRSEIEITLKTTRDFGLQGADNVCCGSFGRVEFLWTAGAPARPAGLDRSCAQTGGPVDD